MWRATLKSILGHKLRLVLTGFAVVLGIAFLSAATVLSDTVGRSFDQLSVSIYDGTDAAVRGREVLGDGDEGPRPKIPAELLETVQRVEGVAAAVGTIGGYAQVIGEDGDTIGGGGPPTFGTKWIANEELNAFRIAEGHPPNADGEIVIDRRIADDGDYALGDTARLLTRTGPIEARVVGIATFGEGNDDSALGATFVGFTESDAVRYLGDPGKFNSIDALASEGLSQDELRDRIAAAVSDSYDVSTGEELIEETKDDFASLVGVIRNVFSAFAYIALFVASFIIYNTFQIIVAQRIREMALLRAVGASRRQVLTSVLLEALVVGVIASLIGFVAGLGLAAAIKGILDAVGFGLPGEGLQVTTGAALLCLIAGTVVTLFAAFFPARRASRVPPVAAIRDVAVEQRTGLRLRVAVGITVTVLGMLLVVNALTADDNVLPRLGLGALLTILGVTALGPVFARPVTRLLGAPLEEFRGVTGGLARANAARNPKRTARTASALMIGVALVSGITVLAASVQKSFDKVIGEQFKGDFVVRLDNFADMGFSPEVGKALKQKSELAGVMAIRGTPARADFGTADPKDTFLVAVDAQASLAITDVGVEQGDLASLGTDGIAVHDEWAEERELHLGDQVPITFVDTGQKTFVVRAVYRNRDLAGNFFVDLPAYDANVNLEFDQQLLIKGADGTSLESARAAIESVTDAYPNLQVQDREEFIDSQAAFIQTMVYFVYGMLALAVIIALLGIANTLALSLVERTRELGLLRAVGMTRGQLRSAVRWEAVLMALFGIVGGLLVGTFFGWALMQGFEEEGLHEFALPIGQLVIVAAVVLALSVVAAVVPAWRAGRLNVLEAISHD